MYAIHRHRAAKNAWCWRVRFSRRGKHYSKSFYDLACGGAKAAKAQAIAWRDEQLAVIKALTMLEFHQQKRSNNISGVAGVHFHKTPAQPLGFWQAKIKPKNGKRVAKSFSVCKYGEREAFNLAVAARTDLLAQIEDQPYLYHSVAKQIFRSRRIAEPDETQSPKLRRS